MGLDNPLHIAFLVVILLLVFGAKRLPEIGRSLGSGMREFKQSVTGESNRSTRRLPGRPAAARATARSRRAGRPARPRRRPPRPPAQPSPPPVEHQQHSSSPRGDTDRGGRAPLAAPCAGSAPVPIASKAEPGTLLSWSRSSSFQRGSGAPLMYHEEPLSATIRP